VALTTRRDGRLVFVLPWGDLTLIGTTDTDFRGDPDRVTPDGRDVAYLLEATNEAFPTANVGLEDVVSAYAGLRPLVRRGTAGPSESDISREHEIFVDSDGLISVAGGKFTTHRAMAEEVVDLVETRLARRSNSQTRNAPLGPPIEPLEDFMALGIEEASALHLQGRYSAAQVGQRLEARGARDRIVDDRPNLWAEVDIAVREEMALTLSDVLVRRLGLFYEAADQALAVAPDVAARMAGMLGWDSTRTTEEVAAYRALVASHRAFRQNTSRSG
jgi:glycerol-3-phosphate dehydrogenase